MWISEFMVCWSLPIIVPVVAARGRSQIASRGLICSGLVQMAFWSKRILRGVPARVIGSGFCEVAGGEVGSLCGSGASGNEEEVPVATLAVAGLGGAVCAAPNRHVDSRTDAVRQRYALILGRVTGIGKFG